MIIGDWIVYGDQVGWGDLPKLAEALGYELQTLYNYSSTCRAIKSWIRIQDLSFAHHRLVVKFSEIEQQKMLAHAAEHKLSVAAFRNWLQGKKEAPALSSGFDVDATYKATKKFSQRHPSTWTPKDKTAIIDYVTQMRRWLDDLEAKAK